MPCKKSYNLTRTDTAYRPPMRYNFGLPGAKYTSFEESVTTSRQQSWKITNDGCYLQFCGIEIGPTDEYKNTGSFSRISRTTGGYVHYVDGFGHKYSTKLTNTFVRAIQPTSNESLSGQWWDTYESSNSADWTNDDRWTWGENTVVTNGPWYDTSLSGEKTYLLPVQVDLVKNKVLEKLGTISFDDCLPKQNEARALYKEESFIDFAVIGRTPTTVYAIKSRTRFKIPETKEENGLVVPNTSNYLKVTYDILEDPDDEAEDSFFFSQNNSLEVNGVGSLSDWIYIDPPHYGASRYIVNIRFSCRKDWFVGSPQQTMGQLYELDIETLDDLNAKANCCCPLERCLEPQIIKETVSVWARLAKFHISNNQPFLERLTTECVSPPSTAEAITLLGDESIRLGDGGDPGELGVSGKPGNDSLKVNSLKVTGLKITGLKITGLKITGLRMSGLKMGGLKGGADGRGLKGGGLKVTGLKVTGLRGKGLVVTGLTGTGLTGSGLTTSGLTIKGLKIEKTPPRTGLSRSGGLTVNPLAKTKLN